MIPTLYGKPIPIRELYAELYLVDDDAKPSDEDPVEAYFQQQDQQVTGKTQAIESVLAKIQQRAVFIGAPGSGKSTLSKWVAQHLIDEHPHLKIFPVLVQLRDFAQALETDSYLPLIRFFLQDYCGYETNALNQLESLFSEIRFSSFSMAGMKSPTSSDTGWLWLLREFPWSENSW